MKFKLLFLIFFSVAVSLNAQWDTLSTGHNNLNFESIDFRDANNGVMIGNDPTNPGFGLLLVTTDAGNTWGNSLVYQIDRHDIDFAPSGNYWVVGDSGRVIYLGWPTSGYIYQGSISNSDLLCGFPVNDSVFFTAGGNGVLYRTLDYGFHWDTLNSGTLENINDIYFTTAADGWIAADGGYIAHTADSGNTWTFANQPFWGFQNFNSLSYQGSTGLNPYAVGSSGSGMYSTDGGTSWFQFSTNTSVAVNCISFGTTNSGIMCGNNGFVSRSVNAGGNWTTDVVPRVVNYHDVAFGSDSVAYICGDSGVVLKSTVDVSGISENSNASNLNAFPNPASEQLYIELNSEVPATYTMRIFDITGTEVLSQQNIVVSGQRIIEVDNFSELANGVYFITVSNSSGTATSKVVKN